MWPDLRRVEKFIAQVAAKHPLAIILSGGARGVDRTAEQAGIKFGLRVASLRPESLVRWQKPRRPRSVRFKDPDRPTVDEEALYDRYHRAELDYDFKIRVALGRRALEVLLSGAAKAERHGSTSGGEEIMAELERSAPAQESS